MPSLYKRLDKIQNQLQAMFFELNDLKKGVRALIEIHRLEELTFDPNIILLPKHLQETVLALHSIEKGTASDVAHITGKTRAVESLYLNELSRWKPPFAIRHHVSKKIYFELAKMM